MDGINDVKQPRVFRLDMHGAVSGRMTRRWDIVNSRLNIGCIIHQDQSLGIGRKCLAETGGIRRIQTRENIFTYPVGVFLGWHDQLCFGKGCLARLIQ